MTDNKGKLIVISGPAGSGKSTKIYERIINEAIDKIKQKKYSRELSLCFVESIKIVKQLYNQNLVDTIILSEDKQNLIKTFNGCRVEVVSNNKILPHACSRGIRKGNID